MNTISSQEDTSLFSLRQVFIMSAVSTGYLLLSWLLIGFKPEQVYLVLGFNVLYFSSLSTRRFITGFSIFIIFWIIFDYMKAFPNYLYNSVHIETLYQAEKKAFGIHVAGNILTPNEYWLQHRSTFLDIISGVFYLCWVPVPLAFAVYLFYKKRTVFLQFSLSFLVVNLVGFVIYYAYPAAPPWYVQQHGFGFIPGTPGNTAGLENFDRFFHSGIFQSLYSKSSNVFAAVPSLHAAYMLVVLFYGMKYRMGWVNILFAAIMAGIWFSAIYSSHHYVLDVLAGIACAIFGIALFQWLLLKSRFIKKAVDQFDRAIA